MSKSLATGALDDEGDPVWRDRPVTGTKEEVQEAARWNSRHGGKKLDDRAKLVGHRHMWRSDIIERLVKIRDANAKGHAVPPPRKQAPGMPRANSYAKKLAKAQALKDPLKREAQAAALEGEIIPPSPIGKGPLARVLMETKREFSLSQSELMVLSSGKDPFGLDTPMGHTLGRWLRVRLDLHAPLRVIHLRGVHYLLVSVQATKPDGSPYQNSRDDYQWLNDRVGKPARWLRYIEFDRIIDERNEEAIISRRPRLLPPETGAAVSTGYDGLVLPEPVSIEPARPYPSLSNFRGEQRFCFAVFGEKSSLSPVLAPFAERHGADLFIAVGELSESRAYEMAKAAVEDGRKLVCLTFSDFDPSGFQMPVSIAVKLMAQQQLQFPTFEFIIQPVALTLEQIIRLRLPTAMIDKKDLRVKAWQETFAPPLIAAGLLPESARWSAEDDAVMKTGRPEKGEQRIARPLAQVEIDALASIYPEELDRNAEAAITPYLDQTLDDRVSEAHSAWLDEASEAIERDIDWDRLNMLRHVQRRSANRFNGQLRSLARTKSRLDAAGRAMNDLARAVDLPPAPDVPEPDGQRSETANPLVDSAWGYRGMVRALKGRKSYEGEGE
jgi:hypothetical protein